MKQVIKSLIPPIAWNLMRKLFAKESRNLTFSGQFLTFRDVFDSYPYATNYHSKTSLQVIVDATRQLIFSFRRGDAFDLGWESSRLNILPTVLAVMDRQNKLSILDVGGGLGTCYINLKNACPHQKVSYTILEAIETSQQGKLLFSDYPEVQFISEFPSEVESFDVILFGSSLQYFESYKKIIKTVCNYNSELIILTDQPVGMMATFVCAQVNMTERVIPIMVFNLEELIGLFEAQGYCLILKTNSHYPFHDFSNYGNDVSSSRFYNFIFKKNTK